MKKVRISWPSNEFVIRQTPNGLGNWGDYYFTFEKIAKADYWIIVTNNGWNNLQCQCPPENIIYILMEPTSVSDYFNDNHDDFYNWILENKKSSEEITHESFVSRRWYGEYLEANLKASVAKKWNGVLFETISTATENIAKTAEGNYVLKQEDCMKNWRFCNSLKNILKGQNQLLVKPKL